MTQRSSGAEDIEFLRKLITDHPITDEQAVLLDLLDEREGAGLSSRRPGTTAAAGTGRSGSTRRTRS
jgi:hypothetical protein